MARLLRREAAPSPGGGLTCFWTVTMHEMTKRGLASAGVARMAGGGSRLRAGSVCRSARNRRRGAERERRQAAEAFANATGGPVPDLFDGRAPDDSRDADLTTLLQARPELAVLLFVFADIDQRWGLR